jgi:hypothetical protein
MFHSRFTPLTVDLCVSANVCTAERYSLFLKSRTIYPWKVDAKRRKRKLREEGIHGLRSRPTGLRWAKVALNITKLISVSLGWKWRWHWRHLRFVSTSPWLTTRHLWTKCGRNVHPYEYMYAAGYNSGWGWCILYEPMGDLKWRFEFGVMSILSTWP